MIRNYSRNLFCKFVESISADLSQILEIEKKNLTGFKKWFISILPRNFEVAE